MFFCFFFFFKQKTAYEISACLVGSEMCIRDRYKFAFYVAGFMILVGTFMGRFVCGWLCPFGLIQDLLNKIPLPSKLKIRTFKGDRQLRWLKYGILLVFVILLPLYITDMIGQGYPWFCKLICPVGTLAVSYTHLRAHETGRNLVCRLLLEKKKKKH